MSIVKCFVRRGRFYENRQTYFWTFKSENSAYGNENNYIADGLEKENKEEKFDI